MRIDLNNFIARQIGSDRSAKSDEKSKTPSAAHEDQASFSESKLSASTLIQGAMLPSEARSERVAALRDAVRSGQYKLDPHVMADAMLKEVGQ